MGEALRQILMKPIRGNVETSHGWKSEVRSQKKSRFEDTIAKKERSDCIKCQRQSTITKTIAHQTYGVARALGSCVRNTVREKYYETWSMAPKKCGCRKCWRQSCGCHSCGCQRCGCQPCGSQKSGTTKKQKRFAIIQQLINEFDD